MLELKEKNENLLQEEKKEEVKEFQLEKEPANDSRFALAEILGKTENALKDEFYDYQIKGFMAKVGAFNLDGLDFPTVDQLNGLVKLGVLEYSITPFFYPSFKAVQKKIAGGLKFNAVIDFPKGESSHLARLQDAKFAVKNGVDKVLLTLPSTALFIKNSSKIKAQLTKISRICKNKLGLIAFCDQDNDKLKKAFKCLDSINVERIILFGEKGGSVDKSALTLAKETLSGKKICVFTDCDSVDKVGEYMSLKADAVYLKNPQVIGKSLQEKFTING